MKRWLKWTYVAKRRSKKLHFQYAKNLYQKKILKRPQYFCLKKIQQEGASIFIPSKSHLKVHRNNVGFASIKTMSKKACWNDIDFSYTKITSKRKFEATLVFLSSLPCRRKYFKTTSIFYPSKLHWKSTLK